MFKLNYSFTFVNMFLSAAIIVPATFLIILSFPFELANGGEASSLFKIKDEIRISSKDMSCDYYMEDYRRLYFNFEYPKLIIKENKEPIVVFIDEFSKQFIFLNISDQGLKIINSVSNFEGGNLFTKWPIIFVKENKTYLAVMAKTQSNREWQYRIKVFLLDEQNNKLNLEREVSLTNEKFLNELNSKSESFLSGIYPYSEVKDRLCPFGEPA